MLSKQEAYKAMFEHGEEHRPKRQFRSTSRTKNGIRVLKSAFTLADTARVIKLRHPV